MKTSIYIFSFLLLFFAGHYLKSQPADVPYHYEQVDIDFGNNNGKELTEQMVEYSQFFHYDKTIARTLPYLPSDYVIISDDVEVKYPAPWIRLRFSDVNLGNNSFLVITSKQNNDVQYFNSNSIEEWKNQTAFFREMLLG